MPFSRANITSVSGQVVSSVLVASLPDTPGRARQQTEASRTAGRCDSRGLQNNREAWRETMR